MSLPDAIKLPIAQALTFPDTLALRVESRLLGFCTATLRNVLLAVLNAASYFSGDTCPGGLPRVSYFPNFGKLGKGGEGVRVDLFWGKEVV